MPTQEEVFSWFRSLSGAKRIEIMCGLMSMCIPLEIRYFETIVHDLAKKDYSSFREIEIKANSIADLDTVCKCDLLSEKTAIDFDESEINSNGDSSSSNGPNEPNQKVFSNYPSRSKLIISLCLLQPTNHHCSSITFNLLRQQLVIENIMHAVHNLYIPKNQPLDKLFSEILLLLTMAVYHPAFSYEQRDLLMKQKEEVEQVFIAIFNGPYGRTNALVSTSIQSPQQALSVVNAGPGSVVPLDPQSGPQSNQTVSVPFSSAHHHLQQQSQQQHHSSPHTSHPQPVSQTANSYHPSPYGGHHPTLIAGQLPANVANKSHQQLTHIHPHQQPGPFPISFLPHPVPIANLTYSPQGQVAAASANQSQAFLTNMSILRINSPISSTSPSPKSSPNYNQFEPFVNDSNNTGGTAAAGAGSGSGGGVAVANSGTQQIMYQSFDGNMGGGGGGVPEPSGKSSSISSNSNQLSSASCYNCGHLGHRGGECTSAGGDDNR